MRPFVDALSQGGTSAVNNLRNLIARGGDLTAGFTDLQNLGRQAGIDAATGPGFQTAIEQLMGTAAGRDMSSILSPEVMAALTGGSPNTIPESVRSALTGAAQTSGVGLDQLESTARGDFLFGGPAFDAAVQASIDSALPQIRSIFGGAGAGAGTGGLAQSAVGDAAVRAFAGQYGNERNRQVGAADRLLGRNLDSSRLLASIGEGEAGRTLAGNQVVAGLTGDERGRSLQAALGLPGASLFPSEVLRGLGLEEQMLNQRRIDAPIQAQQALLASIFQGFRPSETFGGNVNQSGKYLNFGFGGEG